VLVIIGLIIGGVVGGISLVKRSQLQAVIAEYKQYDAALNAFKLEYGALAGDMSNAWNYWGATCASTANDCNGNGNGKSPEGEVEYAKLWKHLQLAGMISGNYTITNSGDQVLKVNIPASKYPKGGWYMNRYDWWSNNVDSAIKKNHRWNLGAKRTSSWYHAPLFLSKESYSIDLKIDDGIPYLGTVVSHGGWQEVVGANPNCVVGSGQTATYNVAYESAASCNMMFSTSAFGF
jgi:hypothetical protein